jgi:restriction system protein
MAEITRKRSGELVRGVFKILMEEEEGLPAKEVLKRLEQLVPPTPFERTTYPSRPEVRRYGKIVRFSTIAPVKAGWLQKNKGTWSLTDEGREAFRRFTDPERFDLEAKRLYRKWREARPETQEDEAADEVDTTTLIEEAEENAWTEIKDHLESMNPYDFQNLVAGLIRAMGYHVSWVAPPGADKGIDILAHTDPLGIEGPRIKVQVKRQGERVSVGGLRSFVAVLGDTDVGLFVCTGGFTRDAETEARSQERPKIMLVDLKRLFDLWVEHYQDIAEDYRRLLPLRPIHYLAPSE